MSFNMHQPFVTAQVAKEAVDLDGATVDEAGPEITADQVDPTADLTVVERDTDGTLVGRADAEADAQR